MGNPICEMLGIRYPIIQGAMTNVTDVGLVSAVSNAGGIGILAPGIENVDIEFVRSQIRKLRDVTDNHFGVNVMLASPYAPQIVDLVCEERVPFITTGAGSPAKYMEKFKAANIIVAPVISSKEAAVKMAGAGVDFVIAEGMESGGYIGRLSTFSLIPQVVDAVTIPVVAAGGIADGRTRVGILNSFLRLSNIPTLVLWEKVLIFQAFSFLMHNSVIHIAKIKDASLVVEKYQDLNPLSRSACTLSPLRMEQFEPIRCLVVERAVRALGVIKFYININTSHKLALGVILGPINLLPFHGGKEGLGYSIVMRTAELRERLDNLVRAK